MPRTRRFRVSMASLMMVVLACGAASALFAEVRKHATGSTLPGWNFDAPAILVLGIGLTALALGAIRRHSIAQIGLQAAIACLALLALFQLVDAGWAEGSSTGSRASSPSRSSRPSWPAESFRTPSPGPVGMGGSPRWKPSPSRSSTWSCWPSGSS